MTAQSFWRGFLGFYNSDNLTYAASIAYYSLLSIFPFFLLALAVLGTGGAYAYRTWVGSARNGEPPIIKADTTPTKIVPAASLGSTSDGTAFR